MKFILEIDCNGSAFTDSPEMELSKILYEAAADISFEDLQPGMERSLHDHNGNNVGQWQFFQPGGSRNV